MTAKVEPSKPSKEALEVARVVKASCAWDCSLTSERLAVALDAFAAETLAWALHGAGWIDAVAYAKSAIAARRGGGVR